MKNLLFVLSLGVFALFASCSAKEQTHDQKTRKIVENYIDGFLKDEPIMEYKIDSLVINDITEKQDLEKEAFRYRDLALSTLDKGKELGKEYQNKKEIQSLLSSPIYSSDLKDLKQEYETLEIKVKEYSKLSKELANKSFEADSTKVLYYDVVARGTITSLKNVQKNAIFPFHISKDYKILKEPLELRQEQIGK